MRLHSALSAVLSELRVVNENPLNHEPNGKNVNRSFCSTSVDRISVFFLAIDLNCRALMEDVRPLACDYSAPNDFLLDNLNKSIKTKKKSKLVRKFAENQRAKKISKRVKAIKRSQLSAGPRSFTLRKAR